MTTLPSGAPAESVTRTRSGCASWVLTGADWLLPDTIERTSPVVAGIVLAGAIVCSVLQATRTDKVGKAIHALRMAEHPVTATAPLALTRIPGFTVGAGGPQCRNGATGEGRSQPRMLNLTPPTDDPPSPRHGSPSMQYAPARHCALTPVA